MSKRKDKLGRILRQGESQRSDGRYCFKYVDASGKTKYAYAWTLTIHDPIPKGRKPAPCLREIEKQIQRDLFDGIAPQKMTVYELAEKYVSVRIGVRETTKTGYRTVLNFLAKDEFGCKCISDVSTFDARSWLVRLQQEEGKSYSSIHTIRGVLRPAFQIAKEDGLVRSNPFNFELASVLINDSVSRSAVTPKQERAFLGFVKSDGHFSRYYEGMFLLFKTGVRVSELCGLTKDDINFSGGYFDVRRQLQRSSDMRYYIEEPKSKNGIRRLPMSKAVKEAFAAVIANRRHVAEEPVIDGVSGFLFLDKNGMPEVALHWEKHFSYALAKYNRTYKQQLPKITPHVCRHTYCTGLARNSVSPNRIQYLMGHSDISISLGIYAHLGFEDVAEIMLD